MECNAARSLLDRLGDLGAVERAALDAHLDGCDDCATALRGRERLDARLGQAMLAVPVPHGLKGRVLDALLDDGRKALDFRRRVVRFAKWAGSAAAAVLVAAGGWYALARPAASEVHPDEFFFASVLVSRDRDAVTSEIRKLGVRTSAPSFVDYRYLTGGPSLAILPGTLSTAAPVKVPQLVFTEDGVGAEKGGRRLAVVYVVPRKLCNPDQALENHEGYRYLGQPVRLHIEEESGYVFLMLYTGSDWNWLRAAREM